MPQHWFQYQRDGLVHAIDLHAVTDYQEERIFVGSEEHRQLRVFTGWTSIEIPADHVTRFLTALHAISCVSKKE